MVAAWWDGVFRGGIVSKSPDSENYQGAGATLLGRKINDYGRHDRDVAELDAIQRCCQALADVRLTTGYPDDVAEARDRTLLFVQIARDAIARGENPAQSVAAANRSLLSLLLDANAGRHLRNGLKQEEGMQAAREDPLMARRNEYIGKRLNVPNPPSSTIVLREIRRDFKGAELKTAKQVRNIANNLRKAATRDSIPGGSYAQAVQHFYAGCAEMLRRRRGADAQEK
jgi:hypothetical protein